MANAAPMTAAPMTAAPMTAAAVAPMAAPTTATTAATVALTTAPTAPMMAAPMSRPSVVPMPAATPSGAVLAGPDGRIPGEFGVPDGYLKAPPVFKSVSIVPSRGSTVRTIHLNLRPPVPPKEQNRYWQEAERRMGIKWDAQMPPANSYAERLSAVFAGGDTPDLVLISDLPNDKQLAGQGAFADLTPYLTGDALKEFPNLARFSDYLWKNVTIGGKLYGVPRPSFLVNDALLVREDWTRKLGIGTPKNADEFAAMLTRFKNDDPDGNGKADSWGLGGGGSTQRHMHLVLFLGMFRVPNQWRKNPDGTLTHQIETDEFRAMVAYMRRLWDAGLWHPDAVTMNTNQARDKFVAGAFGAYQDGITNVSRQSAGGMKQALRAVYPAGNVIGLPPPGHDGGKGTTIFGPGFLGYTVIPARAGRDRERVKELLRVLDYFAAPFGSEEWVFMNFGLPDMHHTFTEGEGWILNDNGTKELGDLNRLMYGERTQSFFGQPDELRSIVAMMRELHSRGVENPVANLFSPTGVRSAATLDQLNNDRLVGIVTGREPLSALDGWIRDWRSRGGDTIRTEYTQAAKM